LDRPKVSLLGLALISLVLFTRCATESGYRLGAPIVRASSSFPLLDNRGILHEYKSDTKTYKRITHPRNDELTLYCAVHRQWETVRIAWKRSSLTKIEHREESSYWRWTYMVSRNKKQ